MSILGKQLWIMGVTLALMLVVGAAGYMGIERMNRGMAELDRWSKVDAAMGGEAVQAVQALQVSFALFTADPTEESFATFAGGLEKAVKSLNALRAMVGSESELVEALDKAQEELLEISRLGKEYRSIWLDFQTFMKRCDQLLNMALERLDQAMEQVVDPAKSKAADNADLEAIDGVAGAPGSAPREEVAALITAMASTRDKLDRWSEIRMGMGDEVTTLAAELETGVQELMDLLSAWEEAPGTGQAQANATDGHQDSMGVFKEGIRNLARWSEIGMVVNEDVIIPTLKMQGILHKYRALKKEEDLDRLGQEADKARDGLRALWELASGDEALEAAGDEVDVRFGEMVSIIMSLGMLAQAEVQHRTDINARIQVAIDLLAESQAGVVAPSKEKAVREAGSVRGKSLWWLFGAAGMAVLLSLILVLRSSLSIVRALRRATGVMARMSEGDLGDRVGLKRRDELGMLGQAMDNFAEDLEKHIRLQETVGRGDLSMDIKPRSEKDQVGNALKAMVENMRGLVAAVDETVKSIARGSIHVSDSSQDLSQGATVQAASLEQISSSMGEVGAQVKTNAENAALADRLSNESREAAQDGVREMDVMVQAMSEITDSSQAISKIIKVIDEIAFQTNLLALNAAVEAARAGKHGKGFAVVAEEVRNLAGRSAKAARETAGLIENSNARVQRGAEMADRTSQALTGVVDSITKVSDLASEIASASEEQAQGISQVNLGLGQVEKVTQQNTASAEQNAAASEELKGLAEQLHELVARFKLPEKRPEALEHAGTDGAIDSAEAPALQGQGGTTARVERRALPQEPGEPEEWGD